MKNKSRDRHHLYQKGFECADDKYPGIDLLLPQVDFLEQIKDNLEAIIISHGHEDHAGAIAFFADKID